MKLHKLIVRSLFVITLFIATALVTQAQSSVVYVTANRGTDLNTCSRTSPCRSIQKGVDTVAAGGTVIVLDSGDYAPFTITKSVTVEGAPGIAAIIVTTSGEGITVTTAATTDKVVLRGLTVKGQAGTSSGIHVTAQLGSLHIKNCVVSDFAGNATTAGIFLGAAGNYFITETVVRNNNNFGIGFDTQAGTLNGTVEHCRIENNSLFGLLVQTNSTVAVRDTVSARNRDGFAALGATADLTVENCLATRNGFTGVTALDGGTMRVSNSTLVENSSFGMENNGSTIQSSGNNKTGGNGSGPTSGPITAANVN